MDSQDIEKHPVANKLKEWNASAVAEVLEYRGEITVVIPAELLFNAVPLHLGIYRAFVHKARENRR